jgi:hypothetical protein
MPNRLVLRLAGGLGNQMFEYAMGRSLAARQGATLAVDTWSGFASDHQYRRSYELDALSIEAEELGRRSPAVVRGGLWESWIRFRRSRNSGAWVQRMMPRSTFLIEQEHAFWPQALDTPVVGTCWVEGYWQSPKYFSDVATNVARELFPSPPPPGPARSLGEQIAQEEALAVGVRLYEESTNPAAHARDGRMKTTKEIERALHGILADHPSARPYVFCTHHAAALDEIHWPEGTRFVTHDDGFGDTFARLWLMTQCRHHLFTNSTFYWWGAWLSQSVLGDIGQSIVAADNFINVDSLPESWQRF